MTLNFGSRAASASPAAVPALLHVCLPTCAAGQQPGLLCGRHLLFAGHTPGVLCLLQTDKRFQLADWRVRPLKTQMLQYARMDTHYLLHIYDVCKVSW